MDLLPEHLFTSIIYGRQVLSRLKSIASTPYSATILRHQGLIYGALPHIVRAMCGRFTLTLLLAELEKRFLIDEVMASIQPRYNIAPTQNVAVIINKENPGRVLTEMRWGLIPSWADDPKIGFRMINARAETVAEKPSFKRALTSRRCLIPADSFYEWKKNGKTKTPMRIMLKEEKPFAFAGLWEKWTDPKIKMEIRSCTIITCEANSFMKPIHDRMPIILSEKAEALWLDSELKDPTKLKEVLVPYPAKEMKDYPVSTMVNSAKYDGPECVKPFSK
jgi:putative SOS response-associated peptidase YedK